VATIALPMMMTGIDPDLAGTDSSNSALRAWALVVLLLPVVVRFAVLFAVLLVLLLVLVGSRPDILLLPVCTGAPDGAALEELYSGVDGN
jgi:hypothetical protein